MKKLGTFIFIIIFILAIRHDLTYGLLSGNDDEHEIIETIHIDEDSYIYFEQKVNPGDTVISVIETKLDRSLPVPIKQAIDDFQQLNNGLAPEQMRFGELYKFPLYEDYQEQ